MPRIAPKVDTTKAASINVRLDPDLERDLALYTEFLGAATTPAYVLAQAATIVIRGDREFRVWLQQRNASTPTAETTPGEPAEPAAREPVTAPGRRPKRGAHDEPANEAAA